MRKRIHRSTSVALVALTCLTLTPLSMADSVEIASDGPQGSKSFTGLLTYEADPFDTVGLLTVELTNTSEAASDQYLTGFLFNIASTDPNASAGLLGDPPPTHPFLQCTGAGLNGSLFGDPYDAGAALDGDFQNNSLPERGIASGETDVFEFEISALDAGELSAITFIEGGPYDFDFMVRFVCLDGDFGRVGAVAVPLPAPIALGGMGLAWLTVAARRYRRSSKTHV
jgi:hypothetical protein